MLVITRHNALCAGRAQPIGLEIEYCFVHTINTYVVYIYQEETQGLFHVPLAVLTCEKITKEYT